MKKIGERLAELCNECFRINGHMCVNLIGSKKDIFEVAKSCPSLEFHLEKMKLESASKALDGLPYQNYGISKREGFFFRNDEILL